MYVSIQACLLKKMCSTLSQMYSGCIVSALSTLEVTGTQPMHGRVEPPTTSIRLLVGMSSSTVMFSSTKWPGPPRQMLAPLSGKIKLVFDGSSFLLGRMGVISAGISCIDTDDTVV